MSDTKSKGAIPTPPILKFMKKHLTVALTLGYIWLSVIGILYSESLFSEFKINAFEYFEANDFFLAAFKNQQLFATIIYIIIYVFFMRYVYVYTAIKSAKYTELIEEYNKSLQELYGIKLSYEKSRISKIIYVFKKFKILLAKLRYKFRISLTKSKHRLMESITRLNILLQTVAILLPVLISYMIGINTAADIKLGEGDKVYIKLNERASPIGGDIADKNLSMIGAAGKFIFLYNYEKHIPLIIPMSVISTILVGNEQNQALIEKILEQAKHDNSEIADIKAEMEKLAMDHQRMKNCIESLCNKVTCCRPSEGHLSSINAHPDRKEATNGRPSGSQLLGKVYFEHNSYEIINGQHELESRLLSLPENSNLTVMAFADRSGSSEYNRDLSLRRAIAVRNFIMTLGMENVAIISSVDGLGEEGAPVQTTNGKREPQNRVAFIYLAGPDLLPVAKGESPSACGDPC